MIVKETSLPGVLQIEPAVFGDARGSVMESFHGERYARHGIPGFVQDNFCHSVRGVLRGLHFQTKHPQGKLIYVTRGTIFDVAVDIRRGSPTYARWFGVDLGSENRRQLYIPEGFAHGFCVLSENADIQYKFTDYYNPGDEGGVAWNDPQIGIEWPVESPRLSERDSKHATLERIAAERLPTYRG